MSDAFAELQNIINAAIHHKEHCCEPCNISIWMLGMTAKRLVDHCWMSERNKARRLIAETKWS